MNCEHGKCTGSAILALAVFLCLIGRGQAQQAGAGPDSVSGEAAPARIEQRMDQLVAALDSMRRQLDQSQREMEQLRSELQELRAQLPPQTGGEEAAQSAASLQASVRQLQEQGEILQSEVKQHDQSKVESLSKYPVRLSGMVLFTSLLNSGNVDSIDLPIVALPRQAGEPAGSLSATPRQTILGLDATGPPLWGAHSSASVSMDFFGGIPYADYTTSSGILRLRVAHAGLTWANRSLAVVFDKPLISPLQPASYLSVGEPALAWSGNLWTWSPQLQFKNNAGTGGKMPGLEFGLIDAAAPGSPANNGLRQPSTSERSHQPGYEGRLSYSLPFGDHPVEVGAGGYYSRQTFQYGQHADAWAGTADWSVPFSHTLEFSGELYRGRGIGGLGGGAFKDYVTYSHYRVLHGLNAEGGWAQFKIRMPASLEANLAIGQDNAFAGQLRTSDLASGPTDYTNLARNRTAFGNVIFRPKTYLLFSAEFRNIDSSPITGKGNSNHSLGFASAYLF